MINLSNNRLTGKIPNKIWNSNSILTLQHKNYGRIQYSKSQFYGSLEKEKIHKLWISRYIHLLNNKFNGKDPRETLI